MHIGINLYSKWPFEEVIDAFVENGIDRTFVCIEHPQFEEVMCALKKANITVDNFHAPFKRQKHMGGYAGRRRDVRITFRKC